MSYVPPHKRVSNNQEGPPPAPARMIPQYKKSLYRKLSRRGSNHRAADMSLKYGKKNIYANNSISRWLAVPLVDDTSDKVSSVSQCFVPVRLEPVGQKTGIKSLTFLKGHSQQDHHDTKSCDVEQMWASVAETVHADLLSAFENVRNELSDQNLVKTKASIVARFGKVLFRRNPLLNLDIVEDNTLSESNMKDTGRMFYTNVPREYMEHVKSVVIPELGVQFKEEKEIYEVKLADTKRPDRTVSCKCRVRKDEKKLELYKIELNQVRHLVVDVSCLETNVDLRLALCTTRIMTDLQEEEMRIIRDLISSAVLDPNVKGGLRWPLGKANSGGQYSVIGVWHTKAEVYRSTLLRLRVREADRYDFLTSAGEVKREIDLMLIGITRNLMDQENEAGGVLDMLEDALVLIRNHFLAWDGHLVSCIES